MTPYGSQTGDLYLRSTYGIRRDAFSKARQYGRLCRPQGKAPIREPVRAARPIREFEFPMETNSDSFLENVNHLLKCEEVIYEHFIFSYEKEVLDLGLSHFSDGINNFMPPQKTETYSGIDQPILF